MGELRDALDSAVHEMTMGKKLTADLKTQLIASQTELDALRKSQS